MHTALSSAWLVLAWTVGHAAAAPDRNGSFPAASPDAKHIAFASSRGAMVPADESPWLYMHIYVMDADGSNVRQVTNSATADTAPVWTSDGQWILFGAFDLATQKQTLDAVRPDGTERHAVMPGNFLPWVRLSPDGRRVIFTATENDKPAGIYTVSMDGTRRQFVPTGLDRPWDGIYSPDGKHLVFGEWPRDPDQSAQPIKSYVYIAEADGRNRKLLASFDGFIQLPSWSPDGRSIAYQTYGKKGESDVVVLDVVSGKFRNVSQRQRAYLDETPSWTRDGRLLIQSTRSGRFEVYIMNADGSDVHAITH